MDSSSVNISEIVIKSEDDSINELNIIKQNNIIIGTILDNQNEKLKKLELNIDKNNVNLTTPR